MFGDLNPEEIEHLLSGLLVGRIGCHAGGTTYVVPVSYAYQDSSVYVHTYEGRKIDMMRKNPSVCFQVDNTSELAYWQSVIAWGRFEELTEEKDRAAALKILQHRILPVLSSETMHLSDEWPFPAGMYQKKNGIYFRIQLTEKTGRFEKITGEEFSGT